MKIAHCISGLEQSGGGPTRSVPALARAIADRNVDVTLMTVRSANSIELADEGRLRVHLCEQSSPRALCGSHEMQDLLKSDVVAEVYHGHGIWDLPVHYMAVAASRQRRPYLIAPRGMLEAWALGRSPLKKWVIRRFYQDRDLRQAACLHALAPNEVDSFRNLGLDNPVAIVPNGVDLDELKDLEPHTDSFYERVSSARSAKVLLFLSRIHPKKGLANLLEAWEKLGADRADWLLVIAGPDQLGHRAELEELTGALGLNDVVFTGPLYEGQRLGALGAARAFVLPSFSEGFSMALLEAMASRLPVITTPGCNFPEIEKCGAGRLCQPEVSALADALRDVMRTTDTQRAEMGERGRQLVRDRYTWDRVAEQMIGVYHWLLGSGNRPDCIAGG